jgi:hypothetical protein
MKRILCAAAIVCTTACGGGKGSTPTNPTPTPTPQANRSPSVTSVTATPTFGVQDFGLFTFNASATDPDGDTLTYSWDIAGTARGGATAQIGPFSSGGVGTATATVSDGKGGSATGSVQFIVGSMTGSWNGGVPGTPLPGFTMSLNQVLGGLFTGSINTSRGETGQVGPTGAVATINGSGQIVMRIKVAPFTDFTMTGQMDGTGTLITGSVSGSGFQGQPFVMTKQ